MQPYRPERPLTIAFLVCAQYIQACSRAMATPRPAASVAPVAITETTKLGTAALSTQVEIVKAVPAVVGGVLPFVGG